jgi:PAS domain S-box-containing protein
MRIQGGDETRPAPAGALAPSPDGPADIPARSAWVPDAIPVAGGLLCAVIGLTVMVAWFVRATAVLRFGSQNPMSFNTALALTVTGATLVAVARKRPRATLAAGAFDIVLGAVILAEYALGRSLGIDQLVVTAYLSGPLAVPGRMAVNTAVCLVLVGAGLLVWGPWRPHRQPAALAAAGSAIAVIAVAGTYGYATGNPAAYGWRTVTAMAFLTAVAMGILALTLLSTAWQDSRAGRAGVPRWLPLPVGAVALVLAVWQVIAGRAVVSGRISTTTFTAGATVLGLVIAGLVALVVWLAQQAEGRLWVAVAVAARRGEGERVARESEQRLFQFLDAMPVALFIASPGGHPYYVNDEAERLLGHGVAPDIGADELAETYSVFLPGTAGPCPTDRLPVVRALAGEVMHDDGLEIHKPDGSVIPLEIWGRPVYGPGGKVDYALAAFADMSERNAREKTITSQAALLDLAHDAIFVRDLDGLITYWNGGAEHTYGFTRAEAIGHVSDELLGTQFPEPLAIVEATVAQHGRWEGELTHRRSDGQSIVVESRWAAQREPDGSLLAIMEINRDITYRKDTEREMHRRADEVQALNATLEQRVRQRTVYLQRANKNLAAFSYSAAHELRTPLRALSGFAGTLVEEYGDRLEEAGRGYAGRIQAASGHMGSVLDDLLHLSEVSRAEMNLQEVDLSAQVTGICDQLRTRDPGRRVRVTIENGIRAIADSALIRTALRNMLDNAWKFTAGREHATILFGTMPVTDSPICCYVRDNGAGFDPAYMGKLFTPFQRLHAATEFPGAGIGLASAQRIIDRHGGRVWAEGAVGVGATIYFTLDTNDIPLHDEPILLAGDSLGGGPTLPGPKEGGLLSPVPSRGPAG